jgi:uncharacterized membrane protein YidH (DUF202 family)
LVHLFFVVVFAGAAIALATNRSRLEEYATDAGMGDDNQSRIFLGAMAILVGLAALRLAAAAWRTIRWAVAARYERMLRDPRRAASVPPLGSHLTTLRSDPLPGRAAMTGLLGAGVLIVGGVLALVDRAGGSTSDDPATGESVAMVCIGIALLVMAAFSIRRWMVARRAERMSEEPRPGGGTPHEPTPHRATVVPALSLSVEPGSGRPTPDLQAVTVDANVFGRPPWQIVYLRLFDNEARVREFLRGPWRGCGYVHLIRSALSVHHDELEAAEDGRPTFIDNDAWLLEDLTAQPVRPLPAGRRDVRSVAGKNVEVVDPYGSYPVRSLLCHGSYWQAALDLLLARVDVVVLDLSGYLRENIGTGYELQRVVDRFPVERCVFLADANSDALFLEAQVRDAWSRMAHGSPNAGPQARQVVIFNGVQSWGRASAVQARLDGITVT